MRKRGTAGRRKRGSWCGIRDRRAVAEIAERRGSRGRENFGRGRRNKAGPKRRGIETRRC